MAEVMSSLEPGNEDFSSGGGQDQLGASSVKVGLSPPPDSLTPSPWCLTLQPHTFTVTCAPNTNPPSSNPKDCLPVGHCFQ